MIFLDSLSWQVPISSPDFNHSQLKILTKILIVQESGLNIVLCLQIWAFLTHFSNLTNIVIITLLIVLSSSLLEHEWLVQGRWRSDFCGFDLNCRSWEPWKAPTLVFEFRMTVENYFEANILSISAIFTLAEKPAISMIKMPWNECHLVISVFTTISDI